MLWVRDAQNFLRHPENFPVALLQPFVNSSTALLFLCVFVCLLIRLRFILHFIILLYPCYFIPAIPFICPICYFFNMNMYRVIFTFSERTSGCLFLFVKAVSIFLYNSKSLYFLLLINDVLIINFGMYQNLSELKTSYKTLRR